MLAHHILTQHRLVSFISAGILATLLSACSNAPIEAPVDQPELAFPSPPDDARFYFDQGIRGSADIVQLTEDDKMMYFLTGRGRVSAGFGKPFDIAAYKGRVYVSDTASRDVFIIDKKKGVFDQLSSKSGISFVKPMGLATDDAGNLYVVDNKQSKIFIFSSSNKLLKEIDGKEYFVRPSGIDVTPDGSTAFVVNVGGVDNQNHGVSVIDLKSGTLIRTIGTRGSGDGEFNLPKDVAIGKDGLLYIVDSGNFRVSVLSQEGAYIRSFGEVGVQHGAFSRPKGIAVDPEGHIYVIDAGFGNFQIFNTEGQLLLFVGTRSTRGGPSEFMLPAGIEIDEDGRVYVIDQYLRKLDVFRPAAVPKGKGYFSSPEKPVKKPAQ